MTRICIIRQHYVPLDPRVAREVAALAASGHEVDVICLRRQGEPSLQRDGRVTIYRLPLRHTRGGAPVRYLMEYGAFFALTACSVAALHVRRRYRLVQVNSLPDVLVFAAAVPRLLGARLLLDLQECMPEFFATKFGTSLRHPAVLLIAALEQLSIRFADLVITPTEQMMDAFVARGADARKISVVMDGADEEVFHPVDPRPEQGRDPRFTLICHGTVEERYGLDTVIRAVAILREEIPALRFEIYGDGSFLDQLRRLVAELGVEDRVSFSGGFVPEEQLVQAIAAADVGVVAMKRDAFRDITLAGKMFDYIAMRKPLVVSRTRSVLQTFGSSCFELFDSDDPEDLARAIRTLHADPERRQRLVRRAAEVAEPYRWTRQREVYRNMVERLLEPPRPAALKNWSIHMSRTGEAPPDAKAASRGPSTPSAQ
ncbi:MAG: glycosyltransferase family 4 protein [Actinomycetota bacterium]|nr:glycosyltransferase family 4 protein [Actinomycetota bacterium]